MEKIKNKSEYFWSKVEKTPSCWLWTGGTNTPGYGYFQWREGKKRVSKFAHRFSFEDKVRALAPNEHVCHRCDNPICVNPSHFFIGTHKDNMRDMASKNRVSHGERHWNRKLSGEKAQHIKQLYEKGVTVKALAEKFGISRQSITDITHGRTWIRSTK